MGVALALIRVIETNPLRVSHCCIRLTVTVNKNSCTSVIRRSASVIKVGVVYVNVRVLRWLKEELAWVIDKWLRAISNNMLFKTIVSLRN